MLFKEPMKFIKYILADFFGKVRVEGHNPETEGELVLNLEAHLSRQHRDQPETDAWTISA